MPRRLDKELRAARARQLSLAVGLVALSLLGRLAQLQLANGAYFRSLSEENRVRVDEVRAPRGRILDRNGAVLADTYPSYRVMLDTRHPAFRRNDQALGAVSRTLADALEVDPARLEERVDKGRRESALPLVIARSLNFSQVSRIEERLDRLDGVTVEVVPVRRYPNGSLASHLLGYLGEVQEKEIEADSTAYRPGSLIGRTGIERQYEGDLRGKDGKAFVSVDVHGRRTTAFPELPAVPAISGHDVVLAIDVRLQIAAETALQAVRPVRVGPDDAPASGCVVALDPKTGEVLAFASQPAFDPNIFLGGLSQEEYQTLLTPGKPQHNRALASTYPPGSTWKAITSLAGLESGTITRTTRFDACGGGYQFGNRRFRCWKPAGHGSLDLDGALRNSCDVYYYQLGVRLGLDRLADHAKRFGLGEPTGIDLPGERTSLVPDEAWYQENRGGHGKGVVLNLAIGQGELLISPLSLARFYAAIASDGEIVHPHLLLEVRTADGATVRDARKQSWSAGRLPASPENITLVKNALEQVVMHDEGTGHRARVGDVRVAGKTGTAQNPTGRDHALFACYAPAEAPQIAVVVIVEEAGHGGSVAAPIAQKVMEAFFLPDAQATAAGYGTDGVPSARAPLAFVSEGASASVASSSGPQAQSPSAGRDGEAVDPEIDPFVGPALAAEQFAPPKPRMYVREQGR